MGNSIKIEEVEPELVQSVRVDTGKWRLTFKNGKLSRVIPREKEEWAMTTSLLVPEDKVLVVGTGDGHMQTAAAIVCGVKSVTGYEPQPDVASIAANVTLDNFNLRVRKKAVVGDNREKLTLHIDPGHWSYTSATHPPKEAKREKTVPAVNINDALREREATALMLDVEGMEMELLPAIDQDLAHKLRCAVIEFHANNYGKETDEELVKGFVEKTAWPR